jgi:hypothetical protein
VLIIVFSSVIHEGRALKARLQAAKQKHADITRQVDIVESRLLHACDNAIALREEYNDLIRRQTATFDRVKADANRKEHRAREKNYRKEFQNLWLKTTCEQLFHTLPRELRDVIYTDLMKDTFMQQGSGRRSSNPRRVRWVMEHQSKGPKYHCFKEELVDRNVFRELVQTFYQDIEIEFPLTTKGDFLDFLSRDKWDLGVRPLDHVRSVTLIIYETEFAVPKLQQNLATLTQLAKGAQLKINLESEDDFEHATGEYDELDCCARGSAQSAWGSPLREVDFYARRPADIEPFFEDLQPLLPIFQSIVDAGVRLEISFSNQDSEPIKVTLFEGDMKLDISIMRSIVMGQQLVSDIE